MKRGDRPIRTCAVCAAKKPKFSMTRLALDEQNRIVVDPRQRMPGRGAYACSECLAHVQLDKRMRRAFRGRAVSVAAGAQDAQDAERTISALEE